MPVRFGHVGLVSSNPDRLARFYIDVFDCEIIGPRRELSGTPLSIGMGLAGARVSGLHLRLPGHDQHGPVLEIFRLPEITHDDRQITRGGLMHLAFEVNDIGEALDRLLASSGTRQGAISEIGVDGVGAAAFVYARDPDGNIVELQEWRGGQ